MENSGVVMKKILILFGEMGAGKNYWGLQSAHNLGIEFFDGDDVATKEMKERVANFKPLSRNIISKYIDILAEEITVRAEASERGLVVAQALYSDDNRKDLKLYLECLGYDVSFVWIKTPFVQNLEQLLKRQQGWKWVAYWLFNKPFFQKPTHAHEVL